MSHKATNWLASLPANRLSNSEFRVLFHLCDCHNPSQGCFPTQEYLRANTDVSNGTLNNALRSLEEKGLIQRHRTRDGATKKQRPTHYILGFEIRARQEPSPETGDGISEKPSPKTGDGPVSKKQGDPSPKNGESRLQPTGEEPVKEPVNNQRGTREAAKNATDPARFWAEKINSQAFVPQTAVSAQLARQMLENGLVTEDALRAIGVSW